MQLITMKFCTRHYSCDVCKISLRSVERILKQSFVNFDPIANSIEILLVGRAAAQATHFVHLMLVRWSLLPGPCFNIKTIFPGIRIPILIGDGHECLIFMMGIHMLVRQHIYIEPLNLSRYRDSYFIMGILLHVLRLHLYMGNIFLVGKSPTKYINIAGYCVREYMNIWISSLYVK